MRIFIANLFFLENDTGCSSDSVHFVRKRDAIGTLTGLGLDSQDLLSAPSQHWGYKHVL